MMFKLLQTAEMPSVKQSWIRLQVPVSQPLSRASFVTCLSSVLLFASHWWMSALRVFPLRDTHRRKRGDIHQTAPTDINIRPSSFIIWNWTNHVSTRRKHHFYNRIIESYISETSQVHFKKKNINIKKSILYTLIPDNNIDFWLQNDYGTS